MKVLIVGGGIGGLTLGAFLQDSGIDFHIVEKSPTPQGGYLLVMWDNARDILKKLGLAERYDAEGTQIHSYSIRDGKGKELRTYNLKDFYTEYGSGMTMTNRQALCSWLTEKIDPARLLHGKVVAAVVETSRGVMVTFKDGETHGYDAVVGADGVHSLIREQHFKKHAEVYTGWRAWWMWADRALSQPATVTEYVEAGAVSLVFSGGEKALVILSAPVDHCVWDTPQGRITRLKNIFKSEPAIIPHALAHIEDGEVMPGDLVDIRMRTWVKGRIALLGDAAHSFGPHAGLGAAMAMEDAYVLAGELMKANHGMRIEQALKNYERKRKSRVNAARRLNSRMRLGTLTRSPLLRHAINMIVSLLPETFLVRSYARLLKEEI